MNTETMWHRLAGGLLEYVNEFAYKDKELKESILELEKHTSFDDYWLNKVIECKNINELPKYVKNIAKKYIPVFFLKYPRYKNNENLKMF